MSQFWFCIQFLEVNLFPKMYKSSISIQYLSCQTKYSFCVVRRPRLGKLTFPPKTPKIWIWIQFFLTAMHSTSHFLPEDVSHCQYHLIIKTFGEGSLWRLKTVRRLTWENSKEHPKPCFICFNVQFFLMENMHPSESLLFHTNFMNVHQYFLFQPRSCVKSHF